MPEPQQSSCFVRPIVKSAWSPCFLVGDVLTALVKGDLRSDDRDDHSAFPVERPDHRHSLLTHLPVDRFEPLMRRFPITTIAAGLALAVGAAGSGEIAEARVQLEKKDLAIYGTVMRPGTRQPVSGIRVRLLPAEVGALVNPDGYELAASVTDGDGRFEFVDLAPGSYFIDPDDVRLRKRIDLSSSRPPMDAALWIASQAAVSGRVVYENGEPVVGIPVDLVSPVTVNGTRRLQQDVIDVIQESPVTDEEGYFNLEASPGDYYLLVRFPERGPVYYPGVFYPDDATVLSVPAGGTVSGMDIHVVEQALFRVRFEFAVPEFLPGLSQPVSEFLGNVSPLEAWVRDTGTSSVEILPYKIGLNAQGDDLWVTEPLPPGEHEIELMYTTGLIRNVNWEQLTPIAIVPFSIDNQDVNLGRLEPTARIEVTGRVRLSSAGPPDIDITDLPPFVLMFRFFGFGSRVARAAENGSVVWAFVHPGQFLLSAEGSLPSGWYLQSARSGALDVLREGVFAGGAVTPIDIVVANDGGHVAGTVRNAEGALVPDSRFVLIPSSGRRSPFLRFPAATADASGAYSLDDVPPGEYRALALDFVGMPVAYPIWEDPEFLRPYELRGERITVDPGVRMTVNAEAIPIYD